MGSTSNGYSPFSIRYRFTQSEEEAAKGGANGIKEYLTEQDVEASQVIDERIRPLDPKTYSCSELMFATDPLVIKKSTTFIKSIH